MVNKTTLSTITEEQSRAIYNIVVPLNIISICFCLTAVFVYILIRYRYSSLADRVSFRLSTAITITDIIYSLFQISSLAVTTPGLLCGLTVWGWVFSSLLSIFLTNCIAINLLAVFVHEYRGRYNLEKYYFPISFLLALTLSLLPVSADLYGWDEPESLCWFRGSGEKINIMWQWSTLFAWQLVSVVYCMFVVIAVMVKLKSAKNKLGNTSQANQSAGNKLSLALKQKNFILVVVRKVMCYPLVPIITQTPNFLVETFAYTNRRVNYELLLITYICSGIQGILDALVFSQDVAVTKSLDNLSVYLWKKYINPYEEQYPHKSRNKAIVLTRKNTFELKPPVTSESYTKSSSSIIEVKVDYRNQPNFWECIRYNLIIKIFMAPTSEAVENMKTSEKSPETSQHEMQALQQDRLATLDTECYNDETGDNHVKNKLSVSSLKSVSTTLSFAGDISNETTVNDRLFGTQQTQLHPQSALSRPQFEYVGLHRRSASTPWDSIGNENPMPLSIVENFAHKASASVHIWVDSEASSVERQSVSANDEREQRELECIVKKL